MGLIKKISESLELRREERLIVREMAQERLAKKRALEEKQKEFDKMLDMRLPCENIIDLKNEEGQVEYFLMDTNPFAAIYLLQAGVPPTIKFKQLTGNNVGKVYEECKVASRVYGAIRAIEMGYQVGLFDLTRDGSKLKVVINGYRNDNIDQHCVEDTELEKQYGKTITLRQLLMRWKTDNKQFMNINLDSDYEMVKRLYNSEDILREDKEQTIKK